MNEVNTSNLKSDKPFKSFVQSQIYFLKLIYKEHPLNFILFILLTLFGAVLSPILVLLNKETIDTISSLGENSNIQWAIILLLLTFLLNFSTSFSAELEDYVFTKITLTVNFVLKELLSNKLMKLPLEIFEDSSFYDKIKLAEISLNGSGVNVTQSLVSIAGNIFSLVGIFGVLMTVHWSLPLTLFFSTLPGIIFIFIIKIKSYRMEKNISALEREMGFTDSLFSEKSALKEIKIYDLKDHLLKKWKNLFKKTRNIKLDVAIWDLKSKSFSLLVLQGTHLGVSIFLVYQIFGNELSIGSYVALLSAVTMVQGLFGSLGGNFGNIFETAIYNNSLLSILEYESFEKEKENLLNIYDIEQINIKNASFSYPNSDREILKNISLTVNKGDKISIVGSNGSGKTTLAYCLLGLYEFDTGEFLINNLEFNKIDKTSYYKRIASVFQDFIRYKYNVRENIAFGNLESLESNEEIYNTLEKVGLKNKILNFENQLNTFLAKELPGGTELSGGEWQRIALGRAFLKRADLILLDEPTAALDPINELIIFEMFHELYRDKTTITISHRIGPTKLSDLIIVMDDGKIVEKGTFDELLEQRGVFNNMYEAQSVWYKNKVYV